MSKKSKTKVVEPVMLTPTFDINKVRNWLAALESDDFKQTQGYLSTRNGQSFCCLGVLCKIDPYIKTRKNEKRNGVVFYRKENKHDAGLDMWSYPDRETLNSVGMVSNIFNRDESTKDALLAQTYADLNDIEGKSFKEIAARLRADYAAKGVIL
jgi:hypothetical protein